MGRSWVVALVVLVLGAAAPTGSADPAQPLLGLAFAPRSTRLVELDPETLRPRAGGPSLETSGHAYGWSFSPDRTRLVLGNTAGELLVVDPRRFVVLGKVDCLVKSPPAATVWLGQRLFAVFGNGVVREVELTRWTVTGRASVGRGVYGLARSRAGIVVLLGPPGGIGPARLAVVDARLRVRRVVLSRISAGLKVDRAHQTFEQRRPGLAVDAAGERAFVVAGGAPVAVVTLRTLAVAYHRPAPTSSDAATKAGSGLLRGVRWLGDGMLAVSGVDELQARSVPAGATLVDTKTWTSTTLDAAATSVASSERGLLAWGIYRNGTRTAGTGLHLYAGGDEVFHLFGSEAIWLVRAAGSRAVVGRAGRSGYDLVDLETGSVGAHLEGQPPLPLTGQFPEFAG